MKCGQEIEDKMSEEDIYRPFKYSCYSCYEKYYKHGQDKYDRHLERYKEGENDDGVEKSNKK